MSTHVVKPAIAARPEQAYVAIRSSVTMDSLVEVADNLPRIFGWLAERGLEPAGAPFFKYNVIDMERRLEVEAGVPVGFEVDDAGDIIAGVLPAGRYATVTHVGHPDELLDVTGRLLAWAADEGLMWDMSNTPDGERWGCRLEIYETDPAEEPDMTKWRTVLAFRLAG